MIISLTAIKNTLMIFYGLLIGLVFLFDRSMVGLLIFNQPLGVLIVGFSFLVGLSLFINRVIKKDIFGLKIFNLTINFYLIVIFIFIVSVYFNKTSLFTSYTFRSSSYIWTASLFFLSYFIFSNIVNFEKLIGFFIYPLLIVPIVHYLFSTGYYPNFIIDFFKAFSDKFTFNKASDMMLALVSIVLILFKVKRNTYFNLFYAFFTISLMLPLFLLMSRGSFLSASVFFIILIFYNRRFFYTNIFKSVSLLIVGFATFVISTYNVGDIDFNFNLGSDSQTESVDETIKTIAKKNNTRKAFLSFYVSDGRLYSIDNTTNWRLDIWQDVIEDMDSKNIFFKGYGYNEIIPVMLDPSAPGRLGRDGLNENVHNYFVNILARGGVVQLIIFMLFHYSYIKIWKTKFKNYEILMLFIPAMINSGLDITMEGVQFPFIYYSMLGILFNLNHYLDKFKNTT